MQFKSQNSGIQLKSNLYKSLCLTFEFSGDPQSSAVLVIETSLRTTDSVLLNVTMDTCFPGFEFDHKNKVCVCSSSETTKIPGVSECYNNQFGLLSAGFWAGYWSTSGTPNSTIKEEFVTSSCPPFFCSFNKSLTYNGHLMLRKNKTLLENDVCIDDRYGVLCSKCQNGSSVYYNSPVFSCRPDKYCNTGPTFFIMSEILPVTIFFLFILFFNVDLTCGAVYTSVFYVQILDTLSVDAFGLLKQSAWMLHLLKVYRVFYGIANLRFFRLEELSFCIWKGATTLDVISLKFLVTLYGIFLILTTIIFLKTYSFHACIKVCKKFGRQNVRYSVVKSLSALCSDLLYSLASYLLGINLLR